MKHLKQAARRLAHAWTEAGLLLNALFSPLLLGVVYFCLLTPVALLYRVCQHRPRPGASNFVERHTAFTEKDFENPW